MSKVEELNRRIKEANLKLRDHQKEVEYWLREARTLNEDLAREIKWEQEEARKASKSKAA